MLSGLLMLSLIGGVTLTNPGPPRPGRGEERLVRGECREVFGAQVCVWARVAGDRVLAFGATVPYKVVAAAPADGKMTWPPATAATIPLPAEVRKATGFDHLELSWEHHGHPPGPYLTPHFDFHFYTVTAEQVHAIDCADRRKPARLPAGYALPDIEVPGLGVLEGLCVPTMGMHGVPAVQLASAAPFDQAMLVGYYGGEPIFLEPMVSRAILMARRSFDGAVPLVPNPPKGVRFPSSFRAEYDAAAETYDLVLTMADRR